MLLRHASQYLIIRLLTGLFGFAGLAVYTRLLSPAQYGSYTLVIAAVGLGNAVLFHWMRAALLRFHPAAGQELKDLASTTLGAFILLVVMTGVAGAGSAFFVLDSQIRQLIMIGIPLLWAMAWMETVLTLSRIQLRPMRYGLLSVAKSASALLLGAVGVLVFELGELGPLLGLLVAALLFGAAGLRDSTWQVRPRLNRQWLARTLRYGWPLTATFALVFVISASDRFLIAALLTTADAGVYAPAYDLANQTLTSLMVVVNLAAYPLALKALEAEGVIAARDQLRNNATLLLAVGLPACIGLILLSPNISAVLLGEEFREAASVLLPLVTVATFLSGVRSYYFDLAFQMGHRTIGQLWVMLPAAMANVLLNLWWIPLHGLVGAAWATVVSYGLALLLSIFLGRRAFVLGFPWHDASKVLIAAGGMAIAVAQVSDQLGVVALLGQVALGGIVYGGLVILLNVANCRERLSCSLGGLS